MQSDSVYQTVLNETFCRIFKQCVLFAGLANSGSVASSSNKPSVPSSALSHQALIGQLVSAQSHQLNHQAQNGKILPEPGWIPLTDTPVGKSPNPAITFLQGAVTPAHTALSSQQQTQTTVFRSRPDNQHGFEQQKPTHRPVIVFQQRQAAQQPQKQNFEQLIKSPITIDPKEDTIVIQYNSLSQDQPSHREERETAELSFDERIELLPAPCNAEVKRLIKDILQAPLRKRNSLLGMLRMEEKLNKRKNDNGNNQQRLQQQPGFTRSKQQKKPTQDNRQQADNKPTPNVVNQAFSNFPTFQNTDDRQPKNFNPTTTFRPPPAITLAPITLPPLTEPPPPPPTQTLPPKRFVPEQIFSSEEDSSGETETSNNRQSGLSIEQFLKRYPEVRRVSSRFGDGTSQERVVGNLLLKNNQREEQKEKRPKQQRKSKKNRPTKNNRPPPPTTRRPPPPPTTRRPPPPPTTTTRRPPPPPTTTTRPPPPPTTTQRPTTRRPPPTRRPTTTPSSLTTRQPSPLATDRPQSSGVDNYDYNDYSDYDSELSSDDYSYLYYNEYYEELVPEHHRFLEIQTRGPTTASTTTTTTTTTTQAPRRRRPKSQRKKKRRRKKNKKKVEKQKQDDQATPGNSFSFFSQQPADQVNSGFPNFPNSLVTTEKPKPTLFTAAPKEKPIAIQGAGNQAGPFGYVDKGTFFDDEAIAGFPEMIEVIYQGFVWAMDIRYPDERILHGGIHDILKDKVKREKVFLKNDYIVRVTGRASPYNINRLTFYTAKGKTFGPWGDRRSKESVDFDVSAPAGHALAYFSGTVDFGVPFRSISFHWRPLPN